MDANAVKFLRTLIDDTLHHGGVLHHTAAIIT
jgi:hypothetical protein